MSFYENYCLPHIINFCCGAEPVIEQRQKIVPLAEGRVLEVGMGSGLNLPFYNKDKVDFVWGLEPSEGMRRKAAKNLAQSDIKVEWLDLPGEEIPLDDNSADTILLTYTLCTISDWRTALQHMRRVLKPSGRLMFCEHGYAPDLSVQTWQDRINPYWKRLFGGCHINRPIPDYLEQAGFKITDIESDYLRKTPKIVAYNYRGIARQN